MMLQKKIDSQGFTLLEVLIAVVILAIGIIGLYTLTSTTIRGNGNAAQMTRATALISAQIEEIRLADYTPLISMVNAPDPVSGYVLTQTVTTPLADSKTVTITATKAGSPTVEFVYLKYDDGT